MLIIYKDQFLENLVKMSSIHAGVKKKKNDNPALCHRH